MAINRQEKFDTDLRSFLSRFTNQWNSFCRASSPEWVWTTAILPAKRWLHLWRPLGCRNRFAGAWRQEFPPLLGYGNCSPLARTQRASFFLGALSIETKGGFGWCAADVYLREKKNALEVSKEHRLLWQGVVFISKLARRWTEVRRQLLRLLAVYSSTSMC